MKQLELPFEKRKRGLRFYLSILIGVSWLLAVIVPGVHLMVYIMGTFAVYADDGSDAHRVFSRWETVESNCTSTF